MNKHITSAKLPQNSTDKKQLLQIEINKKSRVPNSFNNAIKNLAVEQG